MNKSRIQAIEPLRLFEDLYNHALEKDFAGIDPFDGLESKLVKKTGLNKFALTRLLFLQFVKRFPFNLRPFLGIAEAVNPKTIALFAMAACRARFTGNRKYSALDKNQNSEKINFLCKRLFCLAKRLETPEGDAIAFGYNFDWQSRAFFAPKGTPTAVPTAFAAKAFMDAYAATSSEDYLEAALQISRFIRFHLNRSFETVDELCFSYTPLDKSLIYNASLLSAEVLARVGAIKKDEAALNDAVRAVRFVIRRQNADGGWQYGPLIRHRWRDNFHTAFILSSLLQIYEAIPEIGDEIKPALNRGINNWIENFFLEDGTPKYFDTRIFPIDVHSVGAAISVLSELAIALNKSTLQLTNSDIKFTAEEILLLAERVYQTALGLLFDGKSTFYYQRLRFFTIKTDFMRWGRAWMALAAASLAMARMEAGYKQ
ncbi:MAG TPA: hypothetical protein VNK26_04020 [Pyrinomonadaceae bacterium]|nr:hypothetical protein [Pyrinomonadaceae bacterium]